MKDLRQELIDKLYKLPPYQPTKCLWMNATTIQHLKDMVTEKSNLTPGDIFSGIPIREDNTIPDFHFETDEARRERLRRIIQRFY